MSVEDQIKAFIAGLAEPKRSEIEALHGRILRMKPGCELWFSDGKDDQGKTVANPTIGYGNYMIRYADGSSKNSFRIGLSANKTGISVYILGLEDKNLLAKNYGPTIGKATVTGYCVRFKSTKEIDTDVLLAAIRIGLEVPVAD